MWEKRVILKYHTDPAPFGGQAQVGPTDLPPTNMNAPGRYGLEPGDGPQDSGLPAATRPQQANLGTFGDADTDILNAPFGPVITRNISKLQEVGRNFGRGGLHDINGSHLAGSDSYTRSYADRDVEMNRLSNNTGSTPTATMVSEPKAASPSISSEA